MTTKTKTAKAKPNLYEEITGQVIESLESDRIPWRRSWSQQGGPRSASTGKLYQGINAMILPLIAELQGFSSPWWITFKQAKKLGGSVVKGQKSSRAVWWSFIEEVDKKTKKKTGKQIPILKSFAVFNFDQCEMPSDVLARYAARLDRLNGQGWVSEDATNQDLVDQADTVLADYMNREPLTFSNGGDRAYYDPTRDHIQMPNRDQFRSPESYLHTLAHEQVHSTGHKDRLNRAVDGQAAFGSETYSREELVAELGASFINSTLGIEIDNDIQDRNAYIQNWVSMLKDDVKAIIFAAGRATKAANMILSIDPDQGEAEEALKYEPKAKK